jgi:hypothetical protein
MLPLLFIDTTSGEGKLAAIMLLIGFAIAVPYIIARVRSKVSEKPTPVRNQWNQIKQQEKVRQGADKILVELVDTSREISGRMDTKIRLLNTLIREAERCIAKLEKLQANMPAGMDINIKPVNSDVVKKEKHRPDNAEVHEDEEINIIEKAETLKKAKEIAQQINLTVGSTEKNNSSDRVTPENEDEEAGNSQYDNISNQVKVSLASQSYTDFSAEESESFSTATNNSPSDSSDRIEDFPLDNNSLKNEADDWQQTTSSKVLGLLEDGHDIPEVARRVGITRQEVSLIKHLKG